MVTPDNPICQLEHFTEEGASGSIKIIPELEPRLMSADLDKQIFINKSVSKLVLLFIHSDIIRPALLLSGKLVSKTNFGNAFILSASN